MNENVEARTPQLPARLPDLASRLVEEAHASDSDRAALTLTPASGGPLKQTLVAVCAGASLDPEHWNGPASLQVISGSADVDGTEARLESGDWTVIPDSGDVRATTDMVALLTVVPDAG